MTLVQHLQELRRRLLVSLVGLIVVTLVVAVFAYHPIFHLLRQPYCDLPANRRTGGFGGDGVTALLEVTQYLSFITTILIIFGVSFEFPLVIVLLNLAGVLSSDRLRSSRRIAIFLLFVFAGVATPTQDPVTMLAPALPLCLLFELSVLFARWNDRRRARKDAESEWAGLGDDETSPTPAPGQAPLPEHASSSSPSELDDP